MIRTGTDGSESFRDVCQENRPQNDVSSVSTDLTYAEYDDYSQYIDDEKPVDNYLSYTRLGKRFSIMKQQLRSTISFGKYVLLDIVITMVVLGILAGVVVLIVRVET